MVNLAMDIGYYQQEEDKARLRERLTKEAINLALQGKWEEAGALNKAIIEKFPTDVEAYNRLGRALTELGDFEQAKEAYRKALELAPENTIARKNLSRLSSLPAPSSAGSTEVARARAQNQKVDPEFFAAEMGKAGIVELRNVASGRILVRLSYGDRVYLRTSGRRLLVENGNGEYLGEVEPKHALRLVKLMEGGNKYDAAVLNVDGDKVKVVIKEIYRHPSQLGRPSFPIKTEERLRSHLLESLLKHKALEEAEAFPEVEALEGEEYLEQEEEEHLPEGFSVLIEEEERSSDL